MKTDWPKYPSHDVVQCVHCERTLPLPLEARRSDGTHYDRPARYPSGSGEFAAFCVDCRMHTFYDVDWRLNYKRESGEWVTISEP